MAGRGRRPRRGGARRNRLVVPRGAADPGADDQRRRCRWWRRGIRCGAAGHRLHHGAPPGDGLDADHRHLDPGADRRRRARRERPGHRPSRGQRPARKPRSGAGQRHDRRGAGGDGAGAARPGAGRFAPPGVAGRQRHGHQAVRGTVAHGRLHCDRAARRAPARGRRRTRAGGAGEGELRLLGGAPFAGVVTVKAAQVGEIVSPLSAGGGFTRTGVGTIVDMDSLEIDVDVNEAYIGQVKPDMPAEAVLGAYPDWKIPAHVIAIVPAADRGKATVKVRVALEQKDARIVPDMGVRVAFLAAKAPAATQAGPKGVLVPPAAIAQRDGKSVVFVVDGGKAVQRAVAPAAQDVGALKLLPEAVTAGERVVVSPPLSLHDGASVTIEEPR
ncbi:MAG: efflux RND transporter periplasmic adaptor subunit [Caldimonas sp.]